MRQATAICIIGPICSGKSTLAERLSLEFSIPYLTETMFNNGLMGMLNHLGDYDRTIIEHCSLLNFYGLIAEHFSSIYIVYIRISESLMESHIQQRIAEGSIGDLVSVDPIEMKQDIERAIYALPQETVYTMRIDSDRDYPGETERIVRELKDTLSF